MSSNPITYMEVNYCNHSHGAVWFHRGDRARHYKFIGNPNRQARRIVRGVHSLTAFIRRNLETRHV